MNTQGQQAMTIAWQYSAPVQLERHVTCQRGAAQQPQLFESAVTSVGKICRDSYRGQGETGIACNELCEQLQSAQACDRVKAVVLRVDCPGRQHHGIINTLVEPSICSLNIWLSTLCSALAWSGQIKALSA